MLKKIFLPLLAICALGFTLINTNTVFADDDPCLQYGAKGTTSYEQCTKTSSTWKKWNEEQKAAESAAEKLLQEKIWACERATSTKDEMTRCMESAGVKDAQKVVNQYYQNYNRINPPKDPNPEGDDDGSSQSVQPTSSDLRPGQLPTDESEKPEELKSSCRGALFLGLTSWDCDTNFESIDSEKQLPTLVATIASNILEDITIIATYLIIGYIIYGGYLYIFANGDTGKVATGKKALNQAFIGLAITLSAKVIIETIRVILFNGEGKFSNTEYLKNNLSAGEMVSSIFQWVIGIAGVVSLIFIVGGGIMYMTSEGEPSKLQTAKNTIKYALIGLVIVALAQTITIFMTNIINNTNQDSSSSYIINEKEIHEKNILS